MLSVKIKVDTKELTAKFKQLGKGNAGAIAQSINSTIRKVRKKAIEDTASKLKMGKTGAPLKKAKGTERNKLIKRARANNQSAKVEVILSGIPVYKVSLRQTKTGVKAKGGRFYAGAFYPGGKGRTKGAKVFKRRSNGGIMLPKIGVRKAIMESYDKRMGVYANKQFTREWRKRFIREARKQGFGNK